MARVAWVVVVLAVLGLNVAGISYIYDEHTSVCTLDAEVCWEEGMLTPEGVKELQELGLSPGFYAGYLGVALPVAVALVFLAVAAGIFWRRSGDRMALFASFMLVLFGGAAAAGTMHGLDDAHPALSFPAQLLEYLGQVSFGVFFYLFPDGRFVPRWTRLLAAAAALLFVWDVFFKQLSATSPAGLFLLGFLFIFWGSLVAAQVYRYRRVSTPDQRQQTKWVIFGFAAGLTGFLAVLIPYTFILPAPTPGSLEDMITVTLIYGFILLLPLSIGMAVLRSRLYDIDVVINRALVYGVLTLSLAAVYFGGVVSLGYVFRALSGQDSQLVVVASTLLIAALFIPLRRRIQDFIDRRFYRRKYDAKKTLEEFGGRLRQETGLETLNAGLVSVVRETVQPSHVSLWLRKPDGDRGRSPPS